MNTGRFAFRRIAVLAALLAPLAALAQNIVFNASFAGDALNAPSYPAVTATTTGWNVASNKNAPAPTESGGVLTVNMAGTTSGFIESQALFAPAPVQLLPGTYLEAITTFVPTFVVTNPSDNLVVGLFNSGGSAPATGMLNSQLSNALTNFSTGGAKGWVGFNGNFPLTGATAKMLTRPAQAGTNNTVQDVLFDGQSGSVGYAGSTTLASTSAPSVTLTNGNTYTIDYKLALSADGNTLTATLSLYNGAGTSGTGTNILLKSYSGNATGANLLTKSFDAFGIGWRADAGTSSPSNLKLIGLTVRTTGGAPWITVQPPASLLVTIGDTLNVPATVAGVVSTYQWQKSTDGGATFTNIDPVANPSAATALLTLANAQATDAAVYRLVVANAAGSTSSTNVTVSTTTTPVPPTIITPPVGGTVLAPAAFAFSVTANGSSPLAYQWLKSTDGGATFNPIGGATAATYAIAATALTDEGVYEVTITNSAGTATSTPVTLTVDQPLTINTPPAGGTVALGASLTLSVGATGKPAPSTYQWYLNGAAIGGANAASYTIGSASATDAGIYTVTVGNGVDTVTSTGASVAVLSPSLAMTAATPTTTPTGVAPDTRLTVTFNQPIAVGIMGQIRIYDVTNPAIPVDTIDIAAGNAQMSTLRAASTISTQALPVQKKTIGGVTNFNYYPITLSGSTATIYPRNNVLTYGHTYYVVIDPGVFTDTTGLSFAGISGATAWTFATKPAAPAADDAWIIVAADGSGDFNTVQGALDFIPAGNTTPRTIFIRAGTYFEQVYFAGKHNLTFLGEDRAGSVIAYPNNNNFNNVGGTYHRMVLEADHANNVTFANLTIQNTTPHGGSQAEALILNGTTTSRGIVTDVNLVSYQDTLQINGQGYVANSHISGDVDFMWGGGPSYFYHCELTSLTSGGYFTQIRNGTGNHGYVFVGCTFDAAAGVTGTYLGRIDPGSGAFPNSEVVVLDSTMGSAANNAFLQTTTGVSGSNYRAGWWLLNNAASASAAPNVHNWTNQLVDGNGSATSNPNTDAFTVMPTDATTQSNYRNATWVLNTTLAGTSFGSWTPQLAPVIAVQPTAQTVNSGAGFSLSVQAFGVPAVTYQWLLNGAPIDGATSATYTVPSAGGGNAGMYAVVVSNGSTSVTSNAVPLVVHGAAPMIALQPAATTGLLGANATLNVWALGDGPLGYQWSKDGTPIPGATGQSLQLTNLQAGDAGSYSVTVANAAGAIASAAAALTTVAPATTLPTMPTIPAGTFDVTAYGATGDGATDNTAAIQAAINAANAAGGGTVEVPPAAAPYLSGPIVIGSNTNLQIDGGAVLQALPFGVYPRSTTAPAHFITITSGSTNVEITGSGVVDGNGAPWWAAYNAGSISNRPRLVQITKATNVFMTGVTFQNSPNFHLAFSGLNNNVTIYDVTISAPGDSPNTDGMDIAGTNFLIQGCAVSDGDDNIVAKPGSVFCRNLYIADCTFGVGHGVSIGGQTNVGLDGMIVTNCTFNGTSTGLRMKADATQGGPVQNVTYSNITMTNVQYPILFYSYYNQIGSPGAVSGSSQTTPTKVNSWNSSPPNSLASSTLPIWQNIRVSNLTATGASGYSTIWGLPLANGLIANVTLDNVTITGGAGLELYDATNVQFTGTTSVGPIVTCNSLGLTGQPQGAAINVGDSVTFTATAVGASGIAATAPTYRWALNGVPLSDGLQSDGSTVGGSATATLTVTNVRVTGAGQYTVTVSNHLDGFDVGSNSLVPGSLPVSVTSSPAVLVVHPLPATITVSDLTQTYDGSAKAPTVTTSPGGLAVQVSYEGGVTPLNAGAYGFTASVADPNYTATPVTDTLHILPAAATVTLGNLNVVYDGTPRSPTVTTSPAGLPVALTYNGNTTTPVTADTYDVVATVTDPNYAGSAEAQFVIAKANPVLTWAPLAAITYGTPLGVSQLSATANVPGTFSYSPGPGTVLNAGANQVLGVVFMPTDTTDFNPASAATTITVNRATALVTLGDLSQPYDGLPKTVTVSTSPSNLAVDVTYGGGATGPVFPGQYAVTAVVNDSNYAGSTTATLSITITALVRHAPVLNGGVDGSVQMLSGENVTLNGSAWISGDLLVPGTPALRLNGLPTIAGTDDEAGSASPTNYSVTLNGRSVLRYLVRRIDPIPMPVVVPPPAPTGTRSVTLNSSRDNPGDFATIRNLTLNGNVGDIAVPPGTYGQLTANGASNFVLGHAGAVSPDVYNLQSLILNGSSRLRIMGPVLIVLANGVTLNGSVGDGAHPEWLTIAVANGGVTLNGNANLAGFVIAPQGMVTINGGTLTGEVTADRLIVNGNAVLAEPH
ncbi:MAG TPA: pectinesterase family protein [Opitutaceae bacterium]|nr:pectinesterase family protein [Opitutaceae bacterium]